MKLVCIMTSLACYGKLKKGLVILLFWHQTAAMSFHLWFCSFGIRMQPSFHLSLKWWPAVQLNDTLTAIHWLLSFKTETNWWQVRSEFYPVYKNIWKQMQGKSTFFISATAKLCYHDFTHVMLKTVAHEKEDGLVTSLVLPLPTSSNSHCFYYGQKRHLFINNCALMCFVTV